MAGRWAERSALVAGKVRWLLAGLGAALLCAVPAKTDTVVNGTLEQVSVLPPVGTNRYAFTYRWSDTNWTAEARLLPGSRSSWRTIESIRTHFDGRETHEVTVPSQAGVAVTEAVYAGEQPRQIPGMAGPLWLLYSWLPRANLTDAAECPAPWPAGPSINGSPGALGAAEYRVVAQGDHQAVVHFWDLPSTNVAARSVSAETPRAELKAVLSEDQATPGLALDGTITFFRYNGRSGAYTAEPSYRIGIHREKMETTLPGSGLASLAGKPRVVLDYRLADILTNGRPAQYLASNALPATNDPRLRAVAAGFARLPTDADASRSNAWRTLIGTVLAALVVAPFLFSWSWRKQRKAKQKEPL